MKLFTNTLFLLTIFFSLNTISIEYSKSSPTEAETQKVEKEISEFITPMNGVSHIGMSACDEKEGRPFFTISEQKKHFERCILIYLENQKSHEASIELFPNKYKNIFIRSTNIGKLELQP